VGEFFNKKYFEVGGESRFVLLLVFFDGERQNKISD
jgi:hypothetical protein